MATSINGMYDSRALQPIHWQREFVRLGLRERLYAGWMSDLADRVEAAVPDALAWIDGEGLGNRVVDAIVAVVNERLAILRGVQQLSGPSARTSSREDARSKRAPESAS
jgi:hypothetical protein